MWNQKQNLYSFKLWKNKNFVEQAEMNVKNKKKYLASRLFKIPLLIYKQKAFK